MKYRFIQCQPTNFQGIKQINATKTENLFNWNNIYFICFSKLVKEVESDEFSWHIAHFEKLIIFYK